MPSKTIEVVSDVPFSVPNQIDVVLDLPAKRFSAYPKVAALVMVSVAGLSAAGFLAFKGFQKLKEEKQAKAAAQVEAELTEMTKPEDESDDE
jgi:hypothetical protein